MLLIRSTVKRAWPIGIRTFSISPQMEGKQEWLIILPDHQGKLSERLRVRPDHLKNIKPLVESKFWVMGGASLEEPIKEGETPKMNGSVMIAQADTKDEVLEKIRNDIYYTSGVWDESKVSKASLVQVIELAELRRVGGLEGSSFQQD